MKPQTIQAFDGDSLTVRVAVFDDLHRMVDLSKLKIEGARLICARLGIDAKGDMVGNNVVNFFVMNGITKVGNYPYKVILEGDGIRYTVAYGTLQVMSLAE